MKQLKKICAYLMVFALAFMFTAAIIPAKQVKADTATTSIKFEYSNGQYTPMEGTVTVSDSFTDCTLIVIPHDVYPEYIDEGTLGINCSVTAPLGINSVTVSYSFTYESNTYSGSLTATGSGGMLMGDGTVTLVTASTDSTAATTEVAPAAPAVPANVQAAQTVLATASVPSISSGAVVAGSGVSVAGVSPVTDGAALTQMTDLVARMTTMSGSQGAVTIQTAQMMDLNATGNGRVNFQVGSQFAGKVAVIGHYHDGVLYFQQRYVKANGTVDPYFSNFSPVIVLVTNQTTALADIPTSEPGATPLSAKASSSTAPKTGESSANTIIFIIGMVALGAAIATYRKRSY